MEVFMTVILALTSAAGLVVIDQLLKVWAFNALPGQPSTLLIPHLLQLTYVENRGAAFGLFQGGVTVLSVLTGLILIGAVVFLVMGKLKHKLATWIFHHCSGFRFLILPTAVWWSEPLC